MMQPSQWFPGFHGMFFQSVLGPRSDVSLGKSEGEGPSSFKFGRHVT